MIAPCPLCASEHTEIIEADLDGWAVECRDCKTTGPDWENQSACRATLEQSEAIPGNRHGTEALRISRLCTG